MGYWGRSRTQSFEFTAFSGADLAPEGRDFLTRGDAITIPFSADTRITVSDNDSRLSGDARRNERGDDHSGQTASITSDDGEAHDSVRIYAEQVYILRDEHGRRYKLAEIEVAGESDTDRDDFYAFVGDQPPAGATLTVVSVVNVRGSGLRYDDLSAGLIWAEDETGAITIEAEDMALHRYRVDDVDAASGDEVIKVQGRKGEASLVFGAESGTYDLDIAYIDEDDGEGRIELFVNGVSIRVIDLTANNNGNGGDASTISSITIENLDLTQGDEITLRGVRDGHEFARIDALTFRGNEAPVAADDAFAGDEDTVITGDVLANDVDPDGDALTIALLTDVANGDLTLNADGTFEYTPAPDFNGEDSFTYQITDPNGETSTATVSLTVTPVNDAPVTDAGAATGDEDTVITGQLTASDIDGDALTFALATDAANGAVVVNADGSFTYTPEANFNGEDSFTFTVDDGNGGSATETVTLTVAPVNDAPVAVDDAITISEDGSGRLDLVANDTDADGDELALLTVDGDAGGKTFDGEVTSDGGRTLTFTSRGPGDDRQLTVTASDDFQSLGAGETDLAEITYEVSDGNGGVDTATLTVTISGENDGPVAEAGAASGDEDTVIEGQLIAADVDGDVLTFALASDAANGAVTVNADGSFTYTPDADFNGEDSFAYTVDDGNGGAATETVTLTVAPVNDAPTLAPGALTVVENAGVQVLDVSAFGASEVSGVLFVAFPPVQAGGSLDGIFTFDPGEDFDDLALGEAQDVSFRLEVRDPVTSDVIAVEFPLVTVTGGETNTTLDLATLGDDVDADDDGSTLTYEIVTGPSAGSATITGTELTFDDEGAFEDLAAGQSRQVEVGVRAIDGAGAASETSTVTITVEGRNDAPVAADDAATVGEDGVVEINLLQNDTDIDAGDSVRLVSITARDGDSAAPGETFDVSTGFARTGMATVTETGLIFATDSGFDDLAVGETDTLRLNYVIEDESGAQTLGRVVVTIEGANDGPVAEAVAVTGDEDTVIEGQLAASDIDGDALTFALETDAANGAVSVNAEGSFTYTPDADFNGEDSFTYTVSDGNGGAATETVTLTVNPVNDAPVIEFPNGFPLRLSDDNPLAVSISNDPVQVAFFDFDGDGDTDALVGTRRGERKIFLDNGGERFEVLPGDDNPFTAFGPDFGNSPAIADFDGDGDDDVFFGTNQGTINLALNDGAGGYTAAVGADNPFDGVDVGALAMPEFVDLDGDGDLDAVIGRQAGDLVVFDNDGAGGFTELTGADNPFDGLSFGLGSAPAFMDFDGDGDLDLFVAASGGDIQFLRNDGAAGYVQTEGLDNPFLDNFASGLRGLEFFDSDGDGDQDAFVTLSDARVIFRLEQGLQPRTFEGLEDNAISGSLGASDVDGDALTFTIDTGPENGAVALDGLGGFTYTPDQDFSGVPGRGGFDGFTYTVSDGNGGFASGEVEVRIRNVNDAPVAEAGAAKGDEDTVLSGTLTATDIDFRPTLTFALETSAANGDVIVNADGAFTYTPDADFNGEDSFTFIVSDGEGGADIETVTLTVNPVNDAPVAEALSLTIDEDSGPNVDQVSASDVDGDDLTFALQAGPSNGTVTVLPNGRFIYTPDGGFNGEDSFTYTVSDGFGGLDTETVSITVRAVNDAPEIAGVRLDGETDVSTAITGEEDTAIAGQLVATDVDGDVLTFAVDTDVANGALTITAEGAFTYTPDQDFSGEDSFTFVVDDGNGGVDTETVTITVTPDPGPDRLFLNGVTDVALGLEQAEQFLFADVSLAENGADFDGGALVIDGLLAADTVTILNEGAGAGEVGVSGAAISFGGAEIGAFTGGVGEALTVTFNADATAAAIEAVIESLTLTSTTEASRELTIRVTDAAGATSDLVEASFAFEIESLNRLDTDDPLARFFAGNALNGQNPLSDFELEQASSLDVVDIDGDGDMDVIVGDFGFVTLNLAAAGPIFGDDDPLYLIENIGTAEAPVYQRVEQEDSPFNFDVIATQDGRAERVVFSPDPTFADLDGDGDLDMLIGSNIFGQFNYFRNDGTASAPSFTELALDDPANPFASLETTVFTGEGYQPDIEFFRNFDSFIPVFVDIDNDGDQDLFFSFKYAIETSPGIVFTTAVTRYAENIGTATDPIFVERTGADDPLGGRDSDLHARIVFHDIDGDGDQDAYIETGSNAFSTLGEFSELTLLRNEGTAESPNFVEATDAENPLFGITVPHRLYTLDFVDLNGDGHEDVILSVELDGVALSLLPGISADDALFLGRDHDLIALINNPSETTQSFIVTTPDTNIAPVANPDSRTVSEDGSIALNFIDNDVDPDGGGLTVVGNSLGITNTVFNDVTSDGGRTGQILIGGPSVIFDTDDGFDDLAVGETDTVSFDYTVEDDEGTQATSTVTFTVQGENDAPDVRDIVVTDRLPFGLSENAISTGFVLSNLGSDVDSDDSGSTLSYQVTGQTGGGSVAVEGNQLVFRLNDEFQGLGTGEIGTVTAEVTATDRHGATDTGTVTYLVQGSNDAPVANADNVSVNEGRVLRFDPLTNDVDPDSPLSLVSLSDGLRIDRVNDIVSDGGRTSRLFVEEDRAIFFANDGFEDLLQGETDTFSYDYTIEDDFGLQSTATVTITINGESEPLVFTGASALPEAEAGSRAAPGYSTDLADLFTSVTGAPFTVSVADIPDGFSLADGVLTQTNPSDRTDVGEQVLTITAEDEAGNTATADVAFTVALNHNFGRPSGGGTITTTDLDDTLVLGNNVPGGFDEPLVFELLGGADTISFGVGAAFDSSGSSETAIQIFGGDGDDTIRFGDDAAVFGSLLVDGGAGADVFEFGENAGLASDGVTINLGDDDDADTLIFEGLADRINLFDWEFGVDNRIDVANVADWTVTDDGVARTTLVDVNSHSIFLNGVFGFGEEATDFLV